MSADRWDNGWVWVRVIALTLLVIASCAWIGAEWYACNQAGGTLVRGIPLPVCLPNPGAR